MSDFLSEVHGREFEPGRPIRKVGEIEPVEGLRILNLGHLATKITEHGVPMHGAPAVGLPLHTNGQLGADMVHVAAGNQFPVHTHPGDHLLLSIGGMGTITVNDVTYSVKPGDIYMVDGMVPHAVGADPDQDHLLVAIGSPHKAVDSPERMAFTDWFGNAVAEPILPTSVIEAQRALADAQRAAATGDTGAHRDFLQLAEDTTPRCCGNGSCSPASALGDFE